jgi:hypothetical protein
VSRQRNFQLRFISLSDAAAYELFIHNLLPRSVSTTKFPTSFYQPVGRCGLSTFHSSLMYEVSILFCLPYTILPSPQCLDNEISNFVLSACRTLRLMNFQFIINVRSIHFILFAVYNSLSATSDRLIRGARCWCLSRHCGNMILQIKFQLA